MNKQEYNKTVSIINNFYNNKIYHIYNDKGLGDNVFNLIFFNIIKNYIINNNIKIYYYTKVEYITQLQEFTYDNVIILSLKEKYKNSLELWINTYFFGYTHTNAINQFKNKFKG